MVNPVIHVESGVAYDEGPLLSQMKSHWLAGDGEGLCWADKKDFVWRTFAYTPNPTATALVAKAVEDMSPVAKAEHELWAGYQATIVADLRPQAETWGTAEYEEDLRAAAES